MNMVLYKTMRQYFPSFNSWMKEMKDPRDKDRIFYSIEQMMWEGILIFMLRLGARRQINFELKTDILKKNLSVLTQAEVEELPHDTTLAYFAERLPVEEIAKVRTKMINRLIRMKALSRFRLLEHYPVSVDATGHLSFDEKHCDHCLAQEHNGRTYYYHTVLEAKILLFNGMTLSIATEFIENKDQGSKESGVEKAKQDCELKAFRRLADRLKKDFPQLKICLLLDALYANATTFDICQKNRWKYIITFKRGSMPATFEEYTDLKKLDEEKENMDEDEDEDIRRKYRWVNDIDYKEHKLNVLECKETQKKRIGKKTKRFIWVTNFELNHQNIRRIQKGGRLRWKTENEGFNTQKNGGYQLEHAYSQHPIALKNFYLLLQIAHIINQLMEKGSLLAYQVKKVFGSLKNISRRLLESLRTNAFDLSEIEAVSKNLFQIRLDDP